MLGTELAPENAKILRSVSTSGSSTPSELGTDHFNLTFKFRTMYKCSGSTQNVFLLQSRMEWPSGRGDLNWVLSMCILKG